MISNIQGLNIFCVVCNNRIYFWHGYKIAPYFSLPAGNLMHVSSIVFSNLTPLFLLYSTMHICLWYPRSCGLWSHEVHPKRPTTNIVRAKLNHFYPFALSFNLLRLLKFDAPIGWSIIWFGTSTQNRIERWYVSYL